MIIAVKVKPRARTSRLTRIGESSYVAELKSPPVDGKANAELVALIARHFGCQRSAVTIKSGGAARTKRIRIDTG